LRSCEESRVGGNILSTVRSMYASVKAFVGQKGK